MKKYIVKVIEDGEDVILPLPPEVLIELDWKEHDVLIWADNKDGSWTLTKKENKDENLPG